MTRRAFILGLFALPAAFKAIHREAEERAEYEAEYKAALEQLRAYPRLLFPDPLDSELELLSGVTVCGPLPKNCWPFEWVSQRRQRP